MSICLQSVPAVGDMAAACVGGRALLAGAGAGAGTGATAGSSGGGGSASPSVHDVHGAVRGAPEPMVVLSDVGSVVAALDVVTVDNAGKQCFPSRRSSIPERGNVQSPCALSVLGGGGLKHPRALVWRGGSSSAAGRQERVAGPLAARGRQCHWHWHGIPDDSPDTSWLAGPGWPMPGDTPRRRHAAS